MINWNGVFQKLWFTPPFYEIVLGLDSSQGGRHRQLNWYKKWSEQIKCFYYWFTIAQPSALHRVTTPISEYRRGEGSPFMDGGRERGKERERERERREKRKQFYDENQDGWSLSLLTDVWHWCTSLYSHGYGNGALLPSIVGRCLLLSLSQIESPLPTFPLGWIPPSSKNYWTNID